MTLRTPQVSLFWIAVGFLGLLCSATSLWAATVKFDIPAQSASSALPAFIKQSGAQVMFVHDEVKDTRTNAISGEYEASAGLALLLKGTTLRFNEKDPGWFLVKNDTAVADKPGSVEGSVREEKSGRPVAGAKVAIAGTELSVLTDKRGRFAFSEAPTGEQELLITAEGLQNARVTDVTVKPGHRHSLSAIGVPVQQEGTLRLEPYTVSAKKNDAVMDLDPYAVEGKRPKAFSTGNIDLTRTENDALPFSTFTARDLVNSGATDIEEFLRARLPQFVSDNITSEGNSDLRSPTDSQNIINLRGWGSGTANASMETVILVNGRRLPNRFVNNNLESNMVQGDIRRIPIAAIERIEILSSAGGAIYGSGATGGVINIILRENFRGGQVTAQYETPWDGHAPRASAELSYSTPLTGGVSLRLTGGWREVRPLNLEDRAEWTVTRLLQAILERNPTQLVGRVTGNPLNTTTTPFIGPTANIRTTGTSASDNLFGPGTSNFTSVPDGYTGGSGIQPFLNRQGVYSIGLSDGALSFSRSKQATLGTRTINKGLGVGFDKVLGKKVKLSLDYAYAKSQDFGAGGYSVGANFTVPLAAVVNPFQREVRVAFDDPYMQRPEVKLLQESIYHEVTAAMRAEIGGWSGIVSATYSEDASNYINTSFYAPVGGWTNAFMTGAYNPFVDMRVVAPASSSFYEEFVLFDRSGSSRANTRQAVAKFSGPLVDFRAGPIVLTAGVEWVQLRRTSGLWRARWINSRTGVDVPFITGDPVRAFTDLPTTTLDRTYQFDTYSGFAETTIPLVSAAQQVPLLRKVELMLSGRVDRSVRNGYLANSTPVEFSTTPWTQAAGLRYDVLEGVTVRASYSSGFRPPSMTDVTQSPPPTINSVVLDRRRNNESVSLLPTQYLTGGNNDLKPMTTVSTNYGLVLAPRWFKGGRVSVDYIESVRDDVVASLTTQQTIDLEADLPDRVQRGSPDGHPSGVGPLTFVDARNVNFRQMSSRSLDLALDYEFVNVFGGRLTISAAASKLISFKVQTTNTTPAVEQVKNPSATFSRSIQWNGNTQVRWERDFWTIGVATRYFDEILIRSSDLVVQGSDRAEWALEHDFFVSYRIPATDNRQRWGLTQLLANSSVTLGLKNAFDRKPRFWATSALGYPSQDSIMGRAFWVQLRKNF